MWPMVCLQDDTQEGKKEGWTCERSNGAVVHRDNADERKNVPRRVQAPDAHVVP